MDRKVCNNYSAETGIFQPVKMTAGKANKNARGGERVKGIGLIVFATLMLMMLSQCGGGQKNKELAAATVVFSIEDAFQLEKGLVVTGEMLTGTVRVGDELIYYNDVGEKVFTCKITAIEQPPKTGLKEASADAQRKHFGFLIEGKTKADFDTDGYLTNGDLLKWLETLKEE